MALKDLIAKNSALTEQAIEEIVADYVRYDPEDGFITFTPMAGGLHNRAKVLVYLTALRGWPFVSDEQVPVDAKPADIEARTGINGGTLRPILKELKDAHVIAEKSGRYSVLPAALLGIREQLASRGAMGSPTRTRRRRAASTKAEKGAVATGDTLGDIKDARKAKSGNLGGRFDKWIDEGFFDAPKTLGDVQKRFHKEGIIVPRTSIPSYLLKAVRAERLTRQEAEVDGKRVWVYHREVSA